MAATGPSWPRATTWTSCSASSPTPSPPTASQPALPAYVGHAERDDLPELLAAGSQVNLEVDLIARYVERMLSVGG